MICPQSQSLLLLHPSKTQRVCCYTQSCSLIHSNHLHRANCLLSLYLYTVNEEAEPESVPIIIIITINMIKTVLSFWVLKSTCMYMYIFNPTPTNISLLLHSERKSLETHTY